MALRAFLGKDDELFAAKKTRSEPLAGDPAASRALPRFSVDGNSGGNRGGAEANSGAGRGPGAAASAGEAGGKEFGSRPISRVLSGTAIHLGCASPRTSSDLPGSRAGHTLPADRPTGFPIWSCSGWGLPCRGVLPPARCALTAPFHPCRPPLLAERALRRSVFCGTFRGLAPPRRYLAPCPAEPGLSSTAARPQRLSGRLPNEPLYARAGGGADGPQRSSGASRADAASSRTAAPSRWARS